MGFLAALDFLPGKKTLIGFVATGGVTMIGLTIKGIVDQVAPNNPIAQTAVDQGIAWATNLTMGMTGYGLVMKIARHAGAGAAGAVVACMVLSASLLMTLGCATNPATGESQVDRELCIERVDQAKAARAGCGLIDDSDARRKCEAGADLAVIAARFGCEFADDVDGQSTQP